jgi:hypothetical protein
MARVARRILWVVGPMMLCASCRVDVNVNVAMLDDGSGVVAITAVADAAVVQQAPDLATDLRFDDAKAAGWNVTGPVSEPGGGLRVVLTQAFRTPRQATQILADVSGPNGPLIGITLSRTRDGALTTFELSGNLQVIGGFDAFMDETLLAAVGAAPYATELAAAGIQPADAAAISFTASLPGNVLHTTSVEQAGTLSWRVPADGSQVDVDTVTEHRDPSNRWAGPLSTGAMIALVVWLAISALFIGYVVVENLRRTRSRLDR